MGKPTNQTTVPNISEVVQLAIINWNLQEKKKEKGRKSACSSNYIYISLIFCTNESKGT